MAFNSLNYRPLLFLKLGLRPADDDPTEIDTIRRKREA